MQPGKIVEINEEGNSIKSKIQEHHPHIVYNNSMNLLLKRGMNLFSHTPVIFSFNSIYKNKYSRWIKKKSLNSSQLTGIVQAGEKGTIDNTVQTILKVQPRTENVVVISGSSKRGLFLADRAGEVLEKYRDRLGYNIMTGRSMEEILRKVKGLPGNTVILYLFYDKDGRNENYIPAKVAAMISENSGVPVYSIYESFMGSGVTGGSMYSYYNEGKLLAELAERVLNGESPSEIPVGTFGSINSFDWRQLERWGIGENDLPGGSRIHFKEESLWEMYKWQIAGVACFLVLESFLVFLLILNILNRKKAESSLKTAYDDLEVKVSERTAELTETVNKLNKSIEEVRVLQGILPICASCKKIRDDQGYWNQLEDYISRHSEVDFSHSICPDCAEKIYPDLQKRGK